ncbi:DUF402 domain-containing protein [Paenibacillus sp. HB172176]|uniref:DUF402 domain-containing protein n=1 Tax=Paenibacillus sp. HB172176 TaxID=2493690 RepID=UPI00143A992C|nr:DUF402 domain-containing protein [Paenibacillus sp. HB172176]
MEHYEECVIKSFKHDGHLHRQWQQNWKIPQSRMKEAHKKESMIVLINKQTPIQESDGKQWISRVPAVSYFIPGQWFNVVALLETGGVRYYCNVASPLYYHCNVLTYIDYDLDVIRTVDGNRYIVDQDEYEQHRQLYHYPRHVQDKVRGGLHALLERLETAREPFHDESALKYYNEWLAEFGEDE